MGPVGTSHWVVSSERALPEEVRRRASRTDDWAGEKRKRRAVEGGENPRVAASNEMRAPGGSWLDGMV